jgi:DNA-directed RNA polymerase subunit RPC12/RpoP
MALISCSECGKEISNKAENCPYCGNPINVKREEYICCPKCRSRELHTGKKGFSGGKAVAGALLTGGIGILAGTIGSKKVMITCLKCGHKFKAGEALTVVIDPSIDESEIIDIIENKGKLAAIRHYENKTNIDSNSCADYVKKKKKKHGITPHQPSEEGLGAGCIIAIVIVAIAAMILALSLC